MAGRCARITGALGLAAEDPGGAIAHGWAAGLAEPYVVIYRTTIRR